jgi:hypothetical protein
MMDIFTARSKPMAVKISPAGSCAYTINISVQILGKPPLVRLTKARVLLTVAEKPLMTVTVGVSHLVGT